MVHMKISSLPYLLTLSLLLIACGGGGDVGQSDGAPDPASDANSSASNADGATSGGDEDGGQIDPDAPCVPKTTPSAPDS